MLPPTCIGRPAASQDVGEQRRGRRLAVRAGDGDDARHAVEARPRPGWRTSGRTGRCRCRRRRRRPRRRRPPGAAPGRGAGCRGRRSAPSRPRSCAAWSGRRARCRRPRRRRGRRGCRPRRRPRRRRPAARRSPGGRSGRGRGRRPCGRRSRGPGSCAAPHRATARAIRAEGSASGRQQPDRMQTSPSMITQSGRGANVAAHSLGVQRCARGYAARLTAASAWRGRSSRGSARRSRSG